MELDFRTISGVHKVSLHNDMADVAFKFLSTQDGVIIETRKHKGKNVTCFKSVSETGVGFKNGMIEIIMFKGEYCAILK